MHVTARTYVGNRGWALDLLEVSEVPSGTQQEWRAHIGGVSARVTNDGDGTLFVLPEPGTAFPVEFRVELVDDNSVVADTADAVSTAWADAFTPVESGDVRYRLYSPVATKPRPLVLFLHGGGEAGTDNWAQMVGTLGAAHLARQRPDHFILAPQAPPGTTPLPPAQRPFAESYLDPNSGWSRPYLADVCGIIRQMITSGEVDPERVFITGVSMGGAGVIRALSVDPDLFAAAAPVCPTMTPETFDILRTRVETPIWVSSAYIDHTPYRHKYLVDAVQELARNGSPHARLTLFSPEQMERYGFATQHDASYRELLTENHNSWVPAYRDEDGILTWLTNQTKDLEPESAACPRTEQ